MIEAYDLMSEFEDVVDLSPNKALGQHFLRDKNIIANIIKAINPQAGERIVEIGPGPGAMTIPLLAAGADVVAVEKDARFQSTLMAGAASRQGALVFNLLDALKADWQDIIEPHNKVVGNLPYNVGTLITVNLLQQNLRDNLQLGEMTFMLQKEVVERFLAAPSTAARGRISIWCELLADGQRLFDVPRGAFNPPPKVTSAMLRLNPLPAPRYAVDLAKLKTLLDMSFNQRRKMLRASLKSVLTEADFEAAHVTPTLRPENLTTKQFCALANYLA